MLEGPGFVLHERARAYHWEGAGLLSIKCFFHGGAEYRLGAGEYCAVDDRSYLILNHGQPYAITVDAAEPVESLCVFFRAGLAEDVHRSLSQPAEALLDDPGAAGAPLAFFDRTYPHEAVLSPALRALRYSLPDEHATREPGWLDEQFHGLMARLLRVHQGVLAEVAALPAVRATTRAELYRRLHRARDYALARYDTPVRLDDLARVAALSPNHLLRSFKLAFGQTPHQFLVDVRLERARHLLQHTDQPITDIGLAVGFESLGSFSWLFRRRHGCSPSAYRQKR